MSQRDFEVEIYILDTRCGKCQYIVYFGAMREPFICEKRNVLMPSYVLPIWAKNCPCFKPYEYCITINNAVQNWIKRGENNGC